jgi:hypothetical protein
MKLSTPLAVGHKRSTEDREFAERSAERYWQIARVAPTAIAYLLILLLPKKKLMSFRTITAVHVVKQGID